MPYKDKAKEAEHRKIYRLNNKERLKIYNQKYREANREKIRKLSIDWSGSNTLVIKNYTFKRRYNVSLEEYNKMFEAQSGCCAICKTHQSEFTRALHIDHCHKSNKIRGLLCVNCNTGLGHFKENVGLLQQAIETHSTYLNTDSKKGLSKFCNDYNNLYSAIKYLQT